MDFEIDRALQFHAERMKKERENDLPQEKIKTTFFEPESKKS
jgi:hypothetical protein|tara:strand:- start:4603 stop:4728 length:126 start_codon:yes stop_codon:yes gene_type:complete